MREVLGSIPRSSIIVTITSYSSSLFADSFANGAQILVRACSSVNCLVFVRVAHKALGMTWKKANV